MAHSTLEIKNHIIAFLTEAYEQLKEDSPGLATLQPAERLLGIEERERGLQVQVASEGLDLDGKIALERILLEKLHATMSSTSGGAAVYFRRKQPILKAKNQPSLETPERPAPFGLKFNRRAIPGVRDVIVVASGKGGVGKSTVSVNLAVALAAAGKKVGLLDADIYGPSAPTMLGLSGPLEVAAGHRIVPKSAYGVKIVSFGFLTDNYSPMISRGPVISKSLQQLVYQTDWGDLDFLVIDLPPGTGDIQLTLIQDVPLRGAVIVTTGQKVALVDAHKALTMFEKLSVPVLGVVENMAAFVCPKCEHHEPIFGESGVDEFSRERKVAIIGRLPLNRRVMESCDSGIPLATLDDPVLSAPFHGIAGKMIG